MSRQESRFHTQWAGQFYVAGELSKRGYLLSFPLGNAKETDLMVESPKGEQFRVEVKSQSTRNFWRYKVRKPEDDVYYVFVYLNEIGKPPYYYILTSKEAMNAWWLYKKRKDPKGKQDLDSYGWGALFTSIEKYEKQEQWRKLPQ